MQMPPVSDPDAEFIAGVRFANEVTRAGFDFLAATTGGLDNDAEIRLPIRQPVRLFQLRVREALRRRLAA